MPKTQKRTERTHYVSQFYLDNFSYGGLLWVYDKEKDEYRQQPPIDTCVIRNYYQYQEDLESIFAFVEGKTSLIVRKVLSEQGLNAEELKMLTFFIALIGVRGPRFEKTLNKVLHDYWTEQLHETLATAETTQAMIKEYETETGKMTKLDADEIMQLFAAGRIEILDERKNSLEMMFPMAISISYRIYPMMWRIIIAPKETAFITTDNPFIVLRQKNYEESVDQNQLIVAGSQVIFPVGSKACIVLEDTGPGLEFVTTDRSSVRRINTALVDSSQRFVIARDERHLRSLIRRRGSNRAV